MADLLRHFSFAARTLRRHPLPSALALGVLALGLGTTISVLAIAEAVFDGPLPVREPERLVYFALRHQEGDGLFPVRLHEAVRWRDSARGFESLAIARRGTAHWRGPTETLRLEVSRVTPSYFSVLGAVPVLGRGLHAEDVGGPPVVLLGHGLWQSHFGGDPEVLGRSMDLGGVDHLVIGVMPPGPETGMLAWRQLWLPLEVDEAAAQERQLWGYSVIARLGEGVGLEAARLEMDGLSETLATDFPAWNTGWGVEMRTVRSWMSESAGAPVKLLAWAALLVLAIACLTAANVLYAMATGRGREMAVRRALGADSRRLLAQLAAEALVLSSLAGVLGFAVAASFGRLAAVELGGPLLQLAELELGPKTMLAAVLVPLVAGLLCSTLAALALRRRTSLRAAVAAPGGRRLRSTLVGLETAFATVAVILSLLLAQSLAHLQAVDPGFEADGLLTLRLDMPADGWGEKEARLAAFRQVIAEVEGLPGVEAAATAGFALPLMGGAGAFQLYVEGHPKGPRPEVVVHAQVISPGFFETFGMPLLEGQPFTGVETWDSHRSVIVNRAFARRYWPDQEAVGRWIEFANGERGTVRGVVGDVRQVGLHESSRPEVYLAWGTVPHDQALAVRVAGEGLPVAESVRRKIADILPATPIYDLQTGEEILRGSYATRAVTAWTLGAFATLAQALGLVGLYGLMLHLVTSRRRDAGIRLAVGARPGDLAAWALGLGAKPVFLGLLAGLGAGLGAARLLQAQLFGVRFTEPHTYALASFLILTSALLVGLLPARRLAATNPVTALRSE